MEIFNIIAGGASILSLLIALFNLNNIIKIKESVKMKQNVNTGDVFKSEITQTGRDRK